MMDCISVENMRLSDADTIANLVPSLELMHRAAMGVFRAVNWYGSVAILVGSGNNGGDGFALACILHSHGIDCTVFTLSQRLSRDSEYYARQAMIAGIRILPFQPDQGFLAGFDFVVDCLLGTGFHGDLRENYRSAIRQINESDACVISVDINSGMNGDTGEAVLAVRSDLTVTIGYVKNGLLTANAGAYMKKLVCADIGIRLVREENKILNEQHWQALCKDKAISDDETKTECEGVVFYRCPNWLDMNVIRFDQ